MGANSIDRGSRDHWTLQPKRIEALYDTLRADGREAELNALLQGPFNGYFSRGVPTEYFEILRKPEDRDPRGYILPASQPDFPTAAKFVNTLIKNGVTVHRATGAFEVGGKRYPEGSFVVLAAQAFRPHVLDMFEPQDHPNDFAYEGAPPTPPYDNAGWTLAFQMGVEFDRILDGFDGPFEPIEGYASPTPGAVTGSDGAVGYLLSHSTNDAATVTNRLLADRKEVFWVTEHLTVNRRSYPAGTIYIPESSANPSELREWAAELGLTFEGISASPSVQALQIAPTRIGLWDEYGGSMPSGWTRWLMEQFEFSFELVYPQTLDAGNLRDRFDLLIFPTGAIPASDRSEDEWSRYFGGGPDPESIPREYRDWLGDVTVQNTVPQLEEFLQAGGTVIAIGSSTVIGNHVGLPMTNHLVGGDGQRLPPSEYYVPGSVLQMRVDNTRPLAFGLDEYVDCFFNNSPVFRLLPEAQLQNVSPVAWFDSDTPLRSGWAWGQSRLMGGTLIVEAPIGEGQVFLFGPEVINRGQPHGTFKFFFNGIHLAGASEVRLGLTP